jgi:hypothetical protein
VPDPILSVVVTTVRRVTHSGDGSIQPKNPGPDVGQEAEVPSAGPYIKAHAIRDTVDVFELVVDVNATLVNAGGVVADPGPRVRGVEAIVFIQHPGQPSGSTKTIRLKCYPITTSDGIVVPSDDTPGESFVPLGVATSSARRVLVGVLNPVYVPTPVPAPLPGPQP